jgi:hypothetical protein
MKREALIDYIMKLSIDNKYPPPALIFCNYTPPFPDSWEGGIEVRKIDQ